MSSFHNIQPVQNQAGHQIIRGNVNFYCADTSSDQRQSLPSDSHVVVEKKGDFSFRRPAGVCLGQAPYIDPELFIGRASELIKMKAKLKPGKEPQKPRRLVLGRQGGVGKTQLTIAYIKKHQHHYQSILWLNAASKATVEDSFQSIAEHLFDAQGVGAQDCTQSVNCVRRWLSDSRNKQWLLVFDNYHDPDQYNLQDYYPLAPHGSIVITSRRSDRVLGRSIHVKSMDKTDDGLQILATRSQRDGVRTDPHARLAVERLGGLPLALATAGAYLRSSPMSFERYLHEYKENWDVDPYRPIRLPEYQDRTLYTTWNISYTRLKDEDSAASELLKLFAYFDNQNIWFGLLHAGAPDNLPDILGEVIATEGRFISAMRTLTEYCFVEVQKSMIEAQKVIAVWSIHNCVHDWILSALNANIDRRQYWYAFDCVARWIDDNGRDRLDHLSYAQVAAHAMHLVQDRFWNSNLVTGMTQDELETAMCAARLLNLQDHLLAAERVYQRVLVGYENLLGSEHPSTLDAANSFGLLYRDQGKLAEAEQMHQRAKAGCEKALGPEHKSTLTMTNNLGLLYRDRAKLVEAEQMYQQALAGYEKTLGPEHELTLGTLDNLGMLYIDQGRLVEAEHMYQRAIRGKERALGLEHTSTLNTINNLGILRQYQNELTEAEKMYQQALAGKEKILGSEHTSTLHTVYSLGSLYSNQGELTKAEQMYQRALAGYGRALGSDHTLTLNTMNNLAILYQNQNNLTEAEKMYQRALAGREKVLGSEHTSTLHTVYSLGNLYSDQDELTKAEQMYLRALAGYEKALGSDHISTLNTINNLGILYQSQNKATEAEKMYQRALAGRERELGPEHPLTLHTVYSLGSLYSDQKELVKAEKMYLRALAGYEKELGLDHTSTLSTVTKLGNSYLKQGRLVEAEQMYRQLLESRTKVLGPEHQDTSDVADLLRTLSLTLAE